FFCSSTSSVDENCNFVLHFEKILPNSSEESPKQKSHGHPKEPQGPKLSQVRIQGPKTLGEVPRNDTTADGTNDKLIDLSYPSIYIYVRFRRCPSPRSSLRRKMKFTNLILTTKLWYKLQQWLNFSKSRGI